MRSTQVAHKRCSNSSRSYSFKDTLDADTIACNQVTKTGINHHVESIGIAQRFSSSSQLESKNEFRMDDSQSIRVWNENATYGKGTRFPNESFDPAEFKTTASEDKFCLENIDHISAAETGTAYHTAASRSTHTEGQSSGDIKKAKDFKKQLKQQKMLQNWKMAVMTVALVIGVFVTWLPFMISRLGALFNKGDPSSDIDYYTAVFTMVNSVINSYLVLATRKDIWKVVLRRTQLCQSN